MLIEVLTWEEIQALPEFQKDGIYTSTVEWCLDKDEEFESRYPDRIVELLYAWPDIDGDYESEDYFYPTCIIKRFIFDRPLYGTHRILKRNPYGIPI